MKKYAILRHEKIKSLKVLEDAQKHNARQVYVPNADPSMSKKNKLLLGTNRVLERYNELIDKYSIKVRSNAVLAIEVNLTFSKEALGLKEMDLDKWTKENEKYLLERFGRGRILSAHLHLDETTPHIQALIVPISKKVNKASNRKSYNLCARDFIRNKKQLSILQTKYAKRMEKFGLERGVVFSGAKHKTLKQYYAELNLVEADTQKVTSELLSSEPNFVSLRQHSLT